MIQVRRLTKRYGPTVAVDDLSFDVLPGRVTGFLGPNGAGKSTTMRCIMGLDDPTSGTVRVNGSPYRQLRRPLYEVGATLEAAAIHPGRSARNHLRSLALTNAIPTSRVDEVLDLVGLDTVASRRAGGFSLGMTQRLGIAAALLGDPAVLILDEPVNGLDPEGIVWVRNLLRHLASEGRTVFVSSHLMTEMALTAEHLIVIGRGQLVADTGVDEFVRRASGGYVRVRAPEAERLAGLLRERGASVDVGNDGTLAVSGLDAPEVGELAGHHGVVLHELVAQHASLEEAFMELTRDAIEYQPHIEEGKVA
jgi:ABC-2 type transport system ATP-binding protein